MKFLIISECSERKRYPPETLRGILKPRGLGIPNCDIELEDAYRKVLKNYMLPAREMYQGVVAEVRALVDALRKRGHQVDFYIISARYGLLRENDPVIPYEYTLRGKGKKEVTERLQKMQVYKKLMTAVNEHNYDKAILILGNNYVPAIFNSELKVDFFKQLSAKRIIFIAGKSLKTQIKHPNVAFIPIRGWGERIRKLQEITFKIKKTKLTETA